MTEMNYAPNQAPDMLGGILAQNQRNHPPAASRQNGGRLPPEDYAAMKKAEREHVDDLAEQMTQSVAENGDVFKQYLDLQSRIPYATKNTLLVMAQRPNATRLGDLEYWEEKRCYRQRGETGILISEPGQKYRRGDGTFAQGFDIKKVFDISQMNTRRLKAEPPKPQPTPEQLLTALTYHDAHRIEQVPQLSDGQNALYDQQADKIFARSGMEFEELFRSVAEAIAYADLTTGPDTQANPHFSASCVAYMLCKQHGVDIGDYTVWGSPEVFAGMDTFDVRGELMQIRDCAKDMSRRMRDVLRELAPEQQQSQHRGNQGHAR